MKFQNIVGKYALTALLYLGHCLLTPTGRCSQSRSEARIRIQARQQFTGTPTQQPQWDRAPQALTHPGAPSCISSANSRGTLTASRREPPRAETCWFHPPCRAKPALQRSSCPSGAPPWPHPHPASAHPLEPSPLAHTRWGGGSANNR